MSSPQDSFDAQPRRKMSTAEVEEAVRSGSVPNIGGEKEAINIARKGMKPHHVNVACKDGAAYFLAGGWEVDALIQQMENERLASGKKKSMFDLEFKNPKHFTWLLVMFASMGGLLSGLDQSLISGANLFLPAVLSSSYSSEFHNLLSSGPRPHDATKLPCQLCDATGRRGRCHSFVPCQRIPRKTMGNCKQIPI